ncbi:amidohydrolase family protein [Azospirillum sp. TSO22-1]|uniref:amidohydrolase family protein n=1 Tax=Azospirillum sp. TSO22-1 TaxID=716789 RepID=UPI000D65D623|nr:amidohydrolase family protein [Azospirillum sp. TSO22-1]
MDMANTGTVTGVDSHAHVFRRGLPLAGVRRYAPVYDATPEEYLNHLDAAGLSHGVLVQPSFLGTDNSYLLAALRRWPRRLRGIAVLDPGAPPARLRGLNDAGVVGVRLNLIGRPDPALTLDPWPLFLTRIADLGWQVEVQAEARRLPGLAAGLLRAGVGVVLDHFGRPDPALGVDDPGFRGVLDLGRSGRVWVKLSGAYRCGGAGTARAALPQLKRYFGVERLLWGSDWPHTQFEGETCHAEARARLDDWLPDAAERAAVLVDTPRALFRFGEDPAARHPANAPRPDCGAGRRRDRCLR